MTDAKDKPRPRIILPVVLAFGPGLSFLFGYLAAPVPEEAKIDIATGVFMIATVACRMLTTGTPIRSLWPFPWAVPLVLVMGGLTLWLHDETFIKMRPTLYYAGTAALVALHL